MIPDRRLEFMREAMQANRDFVYAAAAEHDLSDIRLTPGGHLLATPGPETTYLDVTEFVGRLRGFFGFDFPSVYLDTGKLPESVRAEAELAERI